jgi:DNA polymerase III subunit delta
MTIKMTALKAADIDRFIARPDPARPIVLIYGPDAGLVRERVDQLVRASVDDPQDPFALARLEPEDLADNPLRLVEEASTIPLFGGRRAVWAKAGGRINIAPAVEALIAAPSAECRVIIEAGELRRNAPLRVICERAKNAAALPCYADSERDLARLVDDELRAANLSIAPDARAILLSLIGGDRQASRGELRKLILYVHGKDRIELDDIGAVVADASALGVDALIDAAFAGRPADVETQFARAASAGSSAGSILFSALRQVATLHKMRLATENGDSVDQAVERATPPIHFTRKALVTTALKSWTSARLERVMADLAAAALDTRRQAVLADTIAQRALLSIAVNARRKA